MADQEENKEEDKKEEGKIVKKSTDGLGLIKKQLYAKKESEGIKGRDDSLRKLGVKLRIGKKTEEEGATLATTKYKNLAMLRAKRTGRIIRFSVILFVILFVVIAGVSAFVWYRSTQTVTESQMGLSIEAPLQFTAGDEMNYKLKFANNSRVDWNNVEIILSPPRGFIYSNNVNEIEVSGKQLVLNIGDLKSSEAGEVEIKGQLIGEQNETAVARAEIVITPENFPSGRLGKSTILATTITALPMDVALSIPTDAASGERVLATINVRNLSNQALNGVYIKLTPPVGMELADEDSDFSEGYSESESGWLIDNLDSLDEKQFTVVLYVDGQPGEKRAIDIEAGIRQGGEDFTQRELTHVLTVSATEIVIEQLYNESESPLVVVAGEAVQGAINYKNVGTSGLKNVIVELTIDGIAFDPSSLSLTSGSYDPVTKTITWSAATVPELEVVQPQQEGVINFGFKVLPTDEFPKEGEDAKNQIIVTTAKVDSPDLPAPVGQARQVVSDRAVLSVRTDLSLEAAALYDDGRLGIVSSGPLPPEVGQTTTYTVRFRVGSTINDVADIRLNAVLPDGVTYTGKSFMTGGDLEFNDRTGEVSWRIPIMPGLTGRTSPPHELHIQVSIRPGEDKRGEEIKFLNKLIFEAVDQFTDQSVSTEITEFPTTETASRGNGIVQ